MKKRTIILCCMITVFLFMFGSSIFLIKQKHGFRRTIVDIPEFCLPQVVDSLLLCNTQLTQDNPVILMYLHPECDFCHAKAQQIQQNVVEARDIQIVLVSYAERDSLIKFVETYNLVDIPNVVVLMDPQLLLYDRLRMKSIPTSYIYDRQHRLVAVKRGAAKLEKLIQLANQ